MGTLRPGARRLTAREAEKLLSGHPVPADRRGLARLLAAAAAPARPGELTGERAAVEGFLLAYRPPPERQHRLGSALRRTALVKLSAVAAVLCLGGTALAAGTGELPAPAQQSAHDLLSPFGIPAPRHDPRGSGLDRDPGPPATPAAPPPATRPVPPASPTGGPSQSPTPDLVALCRGYLTALARHEQPDPAIRQQLTAAVGDPHRIPQFCTRLLHDGKAPGGGGRRGHPAATGLPSPP